MVEFVVACMNKREREREKETVCMWLLERDCLIQPYSHSIASYLKQLVLAVVAQKHTDIASLPSLQHQPLYCA